MGRSSIRNLAKELDKFIFNEIGPDEAIDILGFSMGGVISRVWIQQLAANSRVSRFITVGCPHFGTYTAQFIPYKFFPAIAEMKRGSALLRELNNDLGKFSSIECFSFFTYWDLMVFPGWQALLPVGMSSSLPCLTHRQLITSISSVELILDTILRK